MATSTIERSVCIDAPIRRVWRAISDPNEIERWYSPGTPWQMTGFEVGSRLYIEDPASGTRLVTQVIEVLEPPFRMVQRSEAEPATRLHYRLAADDGTTWLTLAYDSDHPDKGLEADEPDAGEVVGWMLGSIKSIIEDAPSPYGF